MRSTFERFPELILADATYKTNNQKMPLCCLQAKDENVDSHIVCAFLVQQEDEVTLTNMLQLFTDRNYKWDQIQVVITDIDLGERNVFKKLFLQVCLQICLFHVLGPFSRELTNDKLGITAGENTTLLAKVDGLAYVRKLQDYEEKYAVL